MFDGPVLVAEEDGRVQGFAAYNVDELSGLHVDPTCYRRGIGRALVRAVVKALPHPLSLEVLVGNDAALALYLSEGFAVIRTASGRLAGNKRFPATACVLEFNGEVPLA